MPSFKKPALKPVVRAYEWSKVYEQSGYIRKYQYAVRADGVVTFRSYTDRPGQRRAATSWERCKRVDEPGWTIEAAAAHLERLGFHPAESGIGPYGEIEPERAVASPWGKRGKS